MVGRGEDNRLRREGRREEEKGEDLELKERGCERAGERAKKNWKSRVGGGKRNRGWSW